MRASEETNELMERMKTKPLEKMKDPKWDEYKINDFSKIKSILLSPDYFLGVREDYINIYYKGMSMAKVQVYYHRACKYTTSYYYIEENIEDKQKDEKKQYALSPVMFWSEKYQNCIKEKIKKHVYGFHDGKMRLEKVCQQWIMNKNNSNPNSEWYYVDMEYIYKEKGKSDNHPFGRADLIAIKRKPNSNNKHDVAFVELKVGIDAYKGNPDKNQYKMKCLHEDLYCEEVNDIKLGSGLASHLVDFMHFFNNDFFIKQVKSEIIGMLKWHKEFGLIESDSELANINESQIEDKPSIHIVTYSSVPELNKHDIEEGCRKKVPNVDIKGMKESFYNWIYNSKMAFVDIVNDKDIKGIMKLKKEFIDFKDSEDDTISFTQDINGEGYNFVFKFVDANTIDAWNCI